MSVLLTVIAAIAAFTLITRFHQQSATALGKVGAIVSATTAFAEAWSKTQAISRRLQESPTTFSVTAVAAAPEVTKEVVVPRRSELDDFFDENPSFTPRHRTGGLRGYSAFDPPRG